MKQIEREFPITDRDFETLAALAREHSGISMTDSKRELLYGRLSRRLRALSLPNFESYCRVLQHNADGELERFTNAITTNLTSFFRENHHFEFLSDELVPLLAERNRASRRIRIWSAGCSTGEEPYSIAIVLAEAATRLAGWDARIVATDLDSEVLGRAMNGVYPVSRVAELAATRRQCWFRPAESSGHEAQVEVAPELKSRVAFRQHNLMDSSGLPCGLDLIFCRNVVIYFDKALQRCLFERFANALAPGGHLVIGHSESLYNVSDRFDLLGRTIYRKRQ